MKDVKKIRIVRVYEMELENPQDLTEKQARELFREEESEVNYLISEKIECIK